jgi:hypothetical protein
MGCGDINLASSPGKTTFLIRLPERGPCRSSTTDPDNGRCESAAMANGH